jgi:hypothetical protein
LPSDSWYERWDQVVPAKPTPNQIYYFFEVGEAFFSDALRSRASGQPNYVRALLPLLAAFAEKHEGHQCSVFSDLGDQPWDLDAERWWEWKEQVAAFHRHDYLPRNQIEDHGVRDWPSYVAVLANHPSGYHPFLEAEGDSLIMKVGFENALSQFLHSATQS